MYRCCIEACYWFFNAYDFEMDERNKHLVADRCVVIWSKVQELMTRTGFAKPPSNPGKSSAAGSEVSYYKSK